MYAVYQRQEMKHLKLDQPLYYLLFACTLEAACAMEARTPDKLILQGTDYEDGLYAWSHSILLYDLNSKKRSAWRPFTKTIGV